MANSWFRLYAEFEDDPKIRMMSDAMQTRLVYLMCEKCKGVTLTERHRTFQWRCSDAELAETKRVFIDSGFIDDDWNLVNWNKRQFISDSSTDRTRRYRERHRTSQERHSDASVTPPDTDTDTDTEKTPSKKPSRVKAARVDSKRPKDPRHAACREKIIEYWKSKNTDDCPWAAMEAGALGNLLSGSPDLTPDRVAQLLRNRYRSEVNHSDRPGKWLHSLLSFGSGPLDRFGKPLQNGHLPPKEKTQYQIDLERQMQARKQAAAEAGL